MFENKALKNLRFVCGLFFNYYYFITNILYKDESKEIKIENVEDLKNFYNVYQRHFVVGTEEINSVSFSNLILLYMWFQTSKYYKRDDNETYDSDTIFYSVGNINETFQKFDQDLVDGVFVMKTNNNYIFLKHRMKKMLFF